MTRRRTKMRTSRKRRRRKGERQWRRREGEDELDEGVEDGEKEVED